MIDTFCKSILELKSAHIRKHSTPFPSRDFHAMWKLARLANITRYNFPCDLCRNATAKPGRAKRGQCNPGVSRKYKVTCVESQRADVL